MLRGSCIMKIRKVNPNYYYIPGNSYNNDEKYGKNKLHKKRMGYSIASLDLMNTLIQLVCLKIQRKQKYKNHSIW